jgi:hypothetical protein
MKKLVVLQTMRRIRNCLLLTSRRRLSLRVPPQVLCLSLPLAVRVNSNPIKLITLPTLCTSHYYCVFFSAVFVFKLLLFGSVNSCYFLSVIRLRTGITRQPRVSGHLSQPFGSKKIVYWHLCTVPLSTSS